MTALRAVLDAESRSGVADDRTPAQRRADALGEICRQWLDLADRPTVAGERPHVTVTVDADTVAARRGAGELDHAGPVEVDAVRELACDASLMRVVMSGRSQPLDVGRRTPVVPPSMRRAVIVRDRRCRFPGCDRPHTWCDAHPRGALGRRRADRVGEPVVALPPPPPHGAQETLPPGALERPSEVPETRWLGPDRESTSLVRRYPDRHAPLDPLSTIR
jgi:hypothetical protein